MLSEMRKWIVGYHEHDSLLVNRLDEELNEEDRKSAWVEFEAEKSAKQVGATTSW